MSERASEWLGVSGASFLFFFFFCQYFIFECACIVYSLIYSLTYSLTHLSPPTVSPHVISVMQRPSKISSKASSSSSNKEEDNTKDFIDISGNNDKGLLKKILKKGDGHVCPEGVVAIVHYTGKLTNGTVFDSSRKRRVPFTFNIGERNGGYYRYVCVSV